MIRTNRSEVANAPIEKNMRHANSTLNIEEMHTMHTSVPFEGFSVSPTRTGGLYVGQIGGVVIGGYVG